jgi:hypothetical protein
MALTADRDTVKREGKLTNYPVSAAVRHYTGGMAIIDPATGGCRPGRTAVGDIAVGRCNQGVDNSAGLIGAQRVEVEHGTFRFNNSGGGDAITLANVGADCFIVDDERVALTNGGATRSRAGIIMDVDALGVWVRIEPGV